MATITGVMNQIQSLIDSSNAKTGGAETNLTSAVNVLIEGYGTGSGGSGGGSLPAGVYYKTEKKLPKSKQGHLHFTFKGKKYVIIADGGTSTKYIYEYDIDNDTYNLIQTIEHDSSMMVSLNAMYVYVDNGDYVYLSSANTIARWDGTTFVSATFDGLGTSSNYCRFASLNGKLYMICNQKESTTYQCYLYEIDYENKTSGSVLTIGSKSTSSKSTALFNKGNQMYAVLEGTLYEIVENNGVLSSVEIGSIGDTPRRACGIGNKIYYMNDLGYLENDFKCLDIDTLEVKVLGKNPFSISELFAFDGVLHVTDTKYYDLHYSIHIVE